MLRETFVQEMEQLHDEVLVMSSMVKQALRDSIKVLKKQDLIGARRLFAEDEAINAKRYGIEEAALLLIATQQPVASDMRQIAAFIELSGELERMGDYAKGIAKITLYIGHRPLIKPLVDIPSMCDKVIEMLELAIDAFSCHDVEAAYQIHKRDDEVDKLYNLVHRELLAIMLEQPGKIDQANYLLWAAHNLERAADRVTNICERVIFTVTGEFVELDHVDVETVQ